jgi:uncharacterized membrane protein HdeD (DUF308 family)
MSRAAAIKEAGVPWWLVLMEGVALLILGLLLLANPVKTTIIVVQVIGIYWLIAGIFRIISMFIDHTQWGLKLFSGIIGIIAGILILQYPLSSTLLVGNALIIVLGIQGLIMGTIGLIQGFKGAGWGAIILGGISILFGLLFLGNIMGFTLSLPWAFGILAVIGGIASIIMAFKVK